METSVPIQPKDKLSLRPVAAGGWRGGFSNLLRKELGQWWGTKMWWVISAGLWQCRCRCPLTGLCPS